MYFYLMWFILPGREFFCLRKVFPDQERNISGKPAISEIFPARSNLISNILDSGSLINIFLTV
jgi:hypothetical protein